MNDSQLFRRFALLAFCAVVASSVGCQSGGMAKLNPFDTSAWKAKKEPRTGQPERIVATWTEAVLHQSGKGGMRGFGGKLFFYDRQSAEPIRVTGQLVVYAFEENGRTATDHRPTKRYVFPAEQFAKNESESELGTSYSVWLPWDQVDGEQMQSEVSLIARFEPLQGGGLVVSDQTRHRLPGRTPTETQIAKNPTNASERVQQASAGNEAGQFATQAGFQKQEEPTSKVQMSTTTISLPHRFAQRTGLPALSKPAPLPSTATTGPQILGRPTTTVNYLTPEESATQSLRSRSFGSQPTTHLDQATPVPSPLFGPNR